MCFVRLLAKGLDLSWRRVAVELRRPRHKLARSRGRRCPRLLLASHRGNRALAAWRLSHP